MYIYIYIYIHVGGIQISMVVSSEVDSGIAHDRVKPGIWYKHIVLV